MALKSNKIDAFPNLRMVQTQYMHTDDSVTIIDEEIGRKEKKPADTARAEEKDKTDFQR